MYLKQQVFFVFGLSRSGISATKFLRAREASVYIYDETQSERMEQTITELTDLGAKRVRKEELEKAVAVCDVIVLSPGIPIDHPIPVAFKRRGKAVIGETELAARYMRSNCIAVTGTNGKTTTVSMLTDMLNGAGIEAKSCGNVGTPMLEYVNLQENAVAVAEISSFQLETLNSLCPHIAVVLNVTEDHLNRHYNMENYIFLKAKLLRNLSEAEYAVLNYDDERVRAFAERTKAKILYFSVREKVKGAYYINGGLYFGEEKIMDAGALFGVGLHNIQNALACICAAKVMGVATKDIAQTLTSFKGIKHRIETIATHEGVTYINDSKGTNVDATIKAVEAMKGETILLLGGKNKGYDYGKLFMVISSSPIVHAVLYGENRYELLASARANAFDKITLCTDFEFAVHIAALRAKPGQTVLLSPASASFDAFANYEERGNAFVQIVNSFGEGTANEKADELLNEECQE